MTLMSPAKADSGSYLAGIATDDQVLELLGKIHFYRVFLAASLLVLVPVS